MNRAAAPSTTDSTATGERISDAVSARGTIVPGGSSVWDIGVAQPLPSEPLDAAPAAIDVEPGDPLVEDEPAPAITKPPHWEREQSPHPSGPAAIVVPRPNRHRSRIALAAVVGVAALMVVTALWFLGGTADSVDGADAPSAPTLPAVEPSPDAVSPSPEPTPDSVATVEPVDQREPDPEPTGDQDLARVDADPVLTGDRDPHPVDADPVPVESVEFEGTVELAPRAALMEPAEPAEPMIDESVVEPAEPAVETVEEAAAPAAVVAAPDGPRVEIVARSEPCKFGSDCLVVGYVAHGFDAMPGSFTCEFASGSRFEFRATTEVVGHACATGSLGDSITIEIEGVRSDTVVHD